MDENDLDAVLRLRKYDQLIQMQVGRLVKRVAFLWAVQLDLKHAFDTTSIAEAMLSFVTSWYFRTHSCFLYLQIIY